VKREYLSIGSSLFSHPSLAPFQSIREVELKSLHGRKIAIDASMAIYQFLIAVRSGGPNQQQFMLTNAEGETTSHIQGMFNRTIRFLQEGIKPVFIFDGKPPDLKSHELVKRREKREKAEAALKQAQEEQNVTELDKQSKRLVRAGTKENDDCRKLLQLMGVPVVTAPCEAEAEAAALAKAGKVYATGTEDMDALTFQTPVLIRKMTFASASKSMVQSVNYEKAIEGLNLTHEQFVDLCILLGCDYTENIKGIGPKTALKLIREHGSIEKIIASIDRKKYVVPESWVPNEKGQLKKDEDESESEDEENPPENDETTAAAAIPAYVKARELFHEHPVNLDVELKWKPCQAEELKKFLVDDMCFNAERVDNSIKKLQEAYKANTKPQSRMDAFFAIKPKNPGAVNPAKRKQEAEAAAKKKKQATGRKKK
jgi:flap endonuclease-1